MCAGFGWRSLIQGQLRLPSTVGSTLNVYFWGSGETGLYSTRQQGVIDCNLGSLSRWHSGGAGHLTSVVRGGPRVDIGSPG